MLSLRGRPTGSFAEGMPRAKAGLPVVRPVVPIYGLLLSLIACRDAPVAPPARVSEAQPGGDTTVALGARPSFDGPAANLAATERPKFYAGRALARQPWVRAPSSTDARDGLGPLYNARSCLDCHLVGGRGRVAAEDGPLSRATVVRLSLPGFDRILGVVPEPTYGAQLQVQSTDLAHQLRAVFAGQEVAASAILPEGTAGARWVKTPFTYPDGRSVVLRRPELTIEGLGYGPLDNHVQIGLRHTPPLFGVGLLERIPEADLLVAADPDDRDGDGISGRPNRAWDPEREALRLGRFGLKANQPSLRVQVAAALRDDQGITNPIFPHEVCTEAQPECGRAPSGAGEDGYEISAALLSVLLDFVESIGVPARRKPDDPVVRRGREGFYRAGCPACHVPRFVTGLDATRPHLSRQEIWPYTDLLLHDMGEDLADGRADYLASGSEWRTPPLWGVGLARSISQETGLLHDGRARTVEEAILWHGGEARPSKERFLSMSREDRESLLAFVRSL